MAWRRQDWDGDDASPSKGAWGSRFAGKPGAAGKVKRGRSRPTSGTARQRSLSGSPQSRERSLAVDKEQLNDLACSLHEMRDLSGRKAFEAIKKVADAVFKIIDLNKTGTIDRLEFMNFTELVIDQCSMWSSQTADFSAVDTSGDRRIDREELCAFLKAAYKTAGKRQFVAQLAMAGELLRRGAQEAEGDIYEDLRTGPGCVIPKTEERGINLEQLKVLFKHIRRRCTKEHWRDNNPKSPTAGELLHSRTMNLYQVVDLLIKPATCARSCSYVEFVASDAQSPKWFVSHFWGEAVKDFIACLEQHSADRLLPPESPYWVCAYANNQWDLGADVCQDPAQTSFRHAMQHCQGTVSVLDQDARCYSRVWCCYEIWVSIAAPPVARFQDPYRYDMYTVTKKGAVGITDGCAEADQRSEFPLDAKQKRQRLFPLELCHRAMEIRLQDAQATEEMDRRCILNSIAGRKLDLTPLVDHASYESLNHMLHGIVASACWRCAMEAGESMDRFTAALRDSDLPKLELSFDTCAAVTDIAIKELTTTIGDSLEELNLDLSFCVQISDETLFAIAAAMKSPKNLQRISLCFMVAASRPSPVTDKGVKALAEAIPRSLRWLELSLHGCKAITDASIDALAEHLPHELSGLSLDFAFNANITSKAVRGLTVALKCLDLRVLKLNLHYCSFALQDEAVLALSRSVSRSLQHLALDLRFGEELSDAGLGALFAALRDRAPGLRALSVNCNWCAQLTDAALPAALPSQLQSLRFCLGWCPKITGAGASGLAQALPRSLQELSLQFNECSLLTTESTTWLLANHLPKGLKRLELFLVGCPCAKAVKELIEKKLEEEVTEVMIDA